MCYYGGVLLIDCVYGFGEDYVVLWNIFEEIVNFIVVDLDCVVSLLDGKFEVRGCVIKLVVMVFKVRVLVYVVSDLYDGVKVKVNFNMLGFFVNFELVVYLSGD